MSPKHSFGRSIATLALLLTAGRLSAEEIRIESRMVVKNSKGEIIKGAHLYPGQSVNGKKTKDGILIMTPKGEFLLVSEGTVKDNSSSAIDVAIAGFEQLGNLKSFPILKISSVDKNKEILINLYQYIRDLKGEKFKHLVYSYILKSQTAQTQFSFKNKVNPKYIMLDRFSQEVWGGTDVELCLEVAVWDEKQLVVSRQKSFDFEVTSD